MSSPLLGAPGADNSVRAAREPDLPAIGAVHARSWTGPYAEVLPPALVLALTPDLLAAAWQGAVSAPPSPRHRVHVAVGDGIVAGFVASAPVEPAPVASAPVEHDGTGDDGTGSDGTGDDGTITHASAVELVALEIDPLHQRRGHGSRLLAAVVDTHRGDGTDRLHVWVHVDDAPRAAFLRGAGFAEDGARRRRALVGGDPEDSRAVWPEVRMVAWLDSEETTP